MLQYKVVIRSYRYSPMTVSEELLATFKYFNEAAKYANDYFEEHIKLNFTKNVTISIRDTLKGEGAPDCLVLKLT